MVQSKRMFVACALGGLALAGVALNGWFSGQEAHSRLRTQSSASVVAVEPVVPLPQDPKILAVQATNELKGPGHIEPPRLLQAALARLHQDAVAKFVNSPGFGINRFNPFGKRLVPTKVLKEWRIPWWSPGELGEETTVIGTKDLDVIHRESLKDFDSDKASLAPLGSPTPDHSPTAKAIDLSSSVKTPSVPKDKIWEIKTLDLVGLIKHKEPVVYISEKVPEMKDLKDAATRPLDFFEFAGLEALQRGEDRFVRSKDDTIRMLGAVRADAHCLTCHTNKKQGDLLGAFSYTLRIGEYRIEHGIRESAGQVGSQFFGMMGGSAGVTAPPAYVQPPVTEGKLK